MSGFTLKLIAMITMLIDHATAILIPSYTNEYLIGRSIGRLAFPIFCFLLVEGFLHTSNVKKYIIRLGIFALISEIPFDLAFSDTSSVFGYFSYQNIFFTLFIGLVVIFFMSLIDKKYAHNNLLSSFLDGLVVLGGCVLAMIMATDYNYIGVLLIVSFYLFRSSKVSVTLSVILINLFLAGGLQILASLSMIFIWFYNGKRGPQGNKYIFYIFYPVHILVLYLISQLPLL